MWLEALLILYRIKKYLVQIKGRSIPGVVAVLLIAIHGISIITLRAEDIYISQVHGHGFSFKHGTADAPYVVRSMQQLEKIVEKVPNGSTLRFAKGVYPIGGLKVTNESLTFQGSGDETILFSNKIGQNAIRFSGSGNSLCLKNLQMAYSGGWGDASGITVGVLVVPDALQGKESMDSIILDHVTFRDFNNAIYVTAPVRSLRVEGCSFLYTYGRAGVSNKAPFQHPAVAVLGSATEQTIVRDCYFDGLLDPSFRGVKGNPPQSQRTPMDGFYKSGGGNPKLTIVEHNIVKNHGIEGIICERMNFDGKYVTRITGNKIIGPAYKERSFYGNYCPAIAVLNTQGAEITKNMILGSPLGVDLTFSSWSVSNACTISNNSFSNVLCGARITSGGSKTIFSNNRVFCSSEPAKSVASLEIAWCGLVGVMASGTPIISSNSFQALEPSWDAKTVITSRRENTFVLSTTQGIFPNQGVLIARSSKGLAYFPVRQVSGKEVTVAPEWSASIPQMRSGELVYARSLGNFTSLGAVCSFGSTSKVLVEGNRISGFLQDVATSNGGKVIAMENQVQNVLVTQPQSQDISRPVGTQ